MIFLVRTAFPTLLVYAALAGWAWMSWQVQTKAPSGSVTKAQSVQASQTPLVLGRKELGQKESPRSAALQHLYVARQGAGWVLGNRSNRKRVLLTTSKFSERFIQRWEIREGDRISFNGADIQVEKVTEETLVLKDRVSGRSITWDGALTPQGEKKYTVCKGMLRRNVAWAKWTGRNWLGGGRPEIRLFSIGGGVNCSDRWRMNTLPPGAVAITWQAGKFLVAPGSRRASTLLFRKGDAKGKAFIDLTVPADGTLGKVESLILGQTRYRVRLGADAIRLTPIVNRDYFFADEGAPPNSEALAWLGYGKNALDWLAGMVGSIIIGLIAAGGITFLALLLWLRGRRKSVAHLAQIVLAVAPSVLGIWLTLQLARSVGGPDQGLIVGMAILAWFWASFMLVWAGRLQSFAGWIWLGATLLAGIGTTTLFQLGAGADSTKWLGYYYKHAAILALFAWTIAILSAIPERFWLNLWLLVFNRERVVFLLAGVLLVAMILQFFVGSEEGIAGLQPVEFVKTIFVILLGFVGLHVTQARRREAKAYRDSPLRFLAPYFRFAAIFFLFIGAMVVGVRDFSPMVIMTVVLATWAWKMGGSQGEFYKGFKIWMLVRPGILLFLVGFLALMYWVYNNPEQVPDGFPQKDRIMVWSQPELHPHSGSQVLGSMDLVGQGKWMGAREWFGKNGQSQTLPAVQDDFITAFLINRFGGFAGLAMLITQLSYVLLLFGLGRVVERQMEQGDFREQNAGVVIGFTLYGLAWMHIAHWLISWGNTLGLLPVMGQPMTWLTAGNSHLIAFALVILTVALITGWLSLAYSGEEREEKRKRRAKAKADKRRAKEAAKAAKAGQTA